MTPLDSTLSELTASGIAFVVEHGKRHTKVRFTVCGKRCLVVVSRSASDHRAALNARLTVRREVRKALDSALLLQGR